MCSVCHRNDSVSSYFAFLWQHGCEVWNKRLFFLCRGLLVTLHSSNSSVVRCMSQVIYLIASDCHKVVVCVFWCFSIYST